MNITPLVGSWNSTSHIGDPPATVELPLPRFVYCFYRLLAGPVIACCLELYCLLPNIYCLSPFITSFVIFTGPLLALPDYCGMAEQESEQPPPPPPPRSWETTNLPSCCDTCNSCWATLALCPTVPLLDNCSCNACHHQSVWSLHLCPLISHHNRPRWQIHGHIPQINTHNPFLSISKMSGRKLQTLPLKRKPQHLFKHQAIAENCVTSLKKFA